MMSIIWLVALVLFLVLEGATMGLVSIWFAAGSLVALLVSLVSDGVMLQVFCCLLVSAICLAAVRPVLQRCLGPSRRQYTNADRVIGAQGVVTEEINNLNARGAVAVRGQTWTARSGSGDMIPCGAQVRVLRIEGVKLFVDPVTANIENAEAKQ